MPIGKMIEIAAAERMEQQDLLKLLPSALSPSAHQSPDAMSEDELVCYQEFLEYLSRQPRRPGNMLQEEIGFYFNRLESPDQKTALELLRRLYRTSRLRAQKGGSA